MAGLCLMRNFMRDLERNLERRKDDGLGFLIT